MELLVSLVSLFWTSYHLWCGLPSHLHILENSHKCIVVIQQGRDGHHTNGAKKGGAFTIHGIIALLPLDTPKGFQSPAVGLTYQYY